MSKKTVNEQLAAQDKKILIFVIIVIVLALMSNFGEKKANPVVAKQKPNVVVPKSGTNERLDYEIKKRLKNRGVKINID
jgi:hypothetical protein